MFIVVPIIGSGTAKDPYRPNVPAGIPWSAMIPSKKDGTPRDADCIVYIPDTASKPAGRAEIPVLNIDSELKSRDPKADFTKMRVKE